MLVKAGVVALISYMRGQVRDARCSAGWCRPAATLEVATSGLGRLLLTVAVAGLLMGPPTTPSSAARSASRSG